MDFPTILILTMSHADMQRAEAIIAHDPSVTSLEGAISWALARAPVPKTPSIPITPNQPSVPDWTPLFPPISEPITIVPILPRETVTFRRVKWTIEDGIIMASLHHEPAPREQTALPNVMPFTIAIDTTALIASGAQHVAINPGRHTIIMEDKFSSEV
jgi:hypothetical protein